MPRLLLIVASTRPGRVGETVGRWAAERIGEHGAFELDVVDLLELGLPFLDEPRHPRMRRYTQPHTFSWSERVDACDAVVLVLPEYNHSFTAPLKNAIDFLHHEWAHKPVGFVSYGGVAAGTRAVQALKPVLVALRMFPVFEAVSIPFVNQFLDDERELQPNQIMEDAIVSMLDVLVRTEEALRPLRTR